MRTFAFVKWLIALFTQTQVFRPNAEFGLLAFLIRRTWHIHREAMSAFFEGPHGFSQPVSMTLQS